MLKPDTRVWDALPLKICIKRKTLILKEEAQIETPNRNPWNTEHGKEMVKSNIEIDVGRMSKKDKEEFEKLQDNFEDALPEESKPFRCT